jgi:hypothetical protein
MVQLVIVVIIILAAVYIRKLRIPIIVIGVIIAVIFAIAMENESAKHHRGADALSMVQVIGPGNTTYGRGLTLKNTSHSPISQVTFTCDNGVNNPTNFTLVFTGELQPDRIETGDLWNEDYNPKICRVTEVYE